MARVRASRSGYYREWRQKNKAHISAYKSTHRTEPTVLAVDGEGLTRDGEHTYNYLAVCEGSTPVAAAEKLEGTLSTVQCFETLLEARALYPNSILVGFSLGYDYTHFLRDMRNDKIHALYRPDNRRSVKGGIKPIRWRGYLVGFLRNRLTITRLVRGEHTGKCKGESCSGCKRGQSVTVWDVFGFYQGTFINACLRWGIISKAEHKTLKEMKDARPTFQESQWPEIKAYCHLECQKLCELFVRLREAHKDAGIPLASYFGAGSTAGAILRKMGVKQCLPKDNTPREVEEAASYAFFGGRFECSRVGPVTGMVYSYDIASAYPYQAWALPCLACGKWRHVSASVRRHVSVSGFALVRYSVHGTRDRSLSVSGREWGPFPFRCEEVSGVGPLDTEIEDGSIVYPASSGGGWTYRDEYLAAAEHWDVRAKEAWIYETKCSHRPFEMIADMYIERLRLGKEGAGIVLKLGINSVYGKTAQSIGQPIYRCPIWAGAITSGCRAQLLRLIAQDPGAILSVATDGITSIRPLKPEEPIDTGTADRAAAYGKPGLGSWESKEVPGGVMLIRPGIALGLTAPIKADEDDDRTKARGVGKSVLDRHRELIIRQWHEQGPVPIEISHTVFRGAKSSISQSGEGFNRSPQYGQWVERTTKLSYNPEPKRPFHLQDDGRLSTWAFPQRMVSARYDRAVMTSEAKALIAFRELNREQPDPIEREELLQ